MAQHQDNRGGSGDGGRQRARNEHEIAVAVQAINRNLGAANQEQKEHDRQSLEWIRRTGCAAIVYTFLTAALLAASGYTAYEATVASGAATRQAATADDTAKRQLRAYVGMTPGDVTAFGDQKNQNFILR